MFRRFRCTVHFFVVAILLFSGCQPFCADPTGVVPEDGDYFSIDGSIHFTVFTQDGVKKVLFRGVQTEVVAGVFYVQKGDIGGTICPTDGFAVCAAFTLSDQATGSFIPYTNCAQAGLKIQWEATRTPDCVADAALLREQAGNSPNQIVEIESGTGDGLMMPRSNAGSQATVLLKQGQSRTFDITLPEVSAVQFAVIYSNDGPVGDIVRLEVNGQAFSMPLGDTRGTLPAGEGWNQFCSTELTSPTVSLNPGKTEVILTLTQTDQYGAELDTLLVLATPAQPTCVSVSTVEQLRSAIQQAAGGTTICMGAGTYTLDRSIDVNRDDITIEGAGDQTVIQLADGARDPVFVLGEPVPYAPTITRRNITLRNMRIKGYRSPNPQPSDELSSVPDREHLRNNGVTVRQAENCIIDHVTVENTASGGIVLERACHNIQILNVESHSNRYDGIAWDGDIQNSRIEGCILRNNDAAGLSFDIGPRGNLVTGCTIENNASLGIFLRDSDNNCFTNCTIQGNTQDAVFIANGDGQSADAVGNAFVNNQYLNNGRHGIWQAGDRCRDNCETGGMFSGNVGQAKLESFPLDAPLQHCGMTHACND